MGTSRGATCCVVFPCFSSMLGIVLHVPLDLEADGCGLPSRKNSNGSRHCCRFSLATWPLVAVGLCYRCVGWNTWGLRSYALLCAIQWTRQRQVAVQNGGDFLLKSLSALDVLQRASMSGTCRKPAGLESRTHEICRVDLHPSLVGDMQEKFHAMPHDRAVFGNEPSSKHRPKSAWCVLFGGVWRKPLGVLWREGKTNVMGLRHACRSSECLGKRLGCSHMAITVLKNLNRTCLQIFVSSLLSPSPSLSADRSRMKVTRPTSHLVQSVTVQECTLMLQHLTRSCLPPSLPKPREFPLKKSAISKAIARPLLRWRCRPE